MGRYFIPFPCKVDVLIFDRITGCGNDSKAIASCDDSDMAHRIVDLLNADERLKDQAALTKRR